MTPLEKAPSGIHQPRHTYNASRPKRKKSTNTKKYIGTLLSSHTSSPHSHTDHRQMKRSTASKENLCSSGPVFLPPLSKNFRSCGALSVALTHIKLHTASIKHKCALHSRFLALLEVHKDNLSTQALDGAQCAPNQPMRPGLNTLVFLAIRGYTATHTT